jgi:hypothetical protein
VDIDAHGDGDGGKLAERNLATALELCRRALALGLRPLLTESNGKGGYHLELIFSKPIPAADAYHFGLWLSRGYRPNKPGGIEVFPKRPDRDTEKGFGGGWVRLYGRHHKRDHWTRVYDQTFGVWLEGQEAIDALLTYTGDDPALLEKARAEFTPPPTPPPAPTAVNLPAGPRPANALDRARRYLFRLDAPDPRPEHPMDASTQLLKGAAVCVGFDLSEGESLDLLRSWSTIRAYPEAELRRKLREAERGKPRGWLLERDTFPGGLPDVSRRSSCPFSSYTSEESSSQKRDKETSGKPPGNLPETYAAFLEKPAAMNPWSCPSVGHLAGQLRGSPCLIPAPCHKRDCPVCGEHWRRVVIHRFAVHVHRHDGELYHDCIADLDWGASVKDMRRRAKKLGVPLRYVGIRDNQDNLCIVASVPVLAVARPIEKGDAIEFLRQAVEWASPDPRPIFACRGWAKLAVDPKPEEKASRVPGGATPAAFTATVKAWGDEVADATGSVLKCQRDGLFLDVNGQLDEALRSDFWYEAWVRDAQGNVAGDIQHAKAEQERARVRPGDDRRPAKCKPGHCQYQDSPDTMRPGWIRTACVVCGDFRGNRRAGA